MESLLWLLLFIHYKGTYPDSRDNVKVITEHPLLIRTSDKAYRVQYGGSITLECQVTGNPPIRITWKSYNSTIIGGLNFEIVEEVENSSIKTSLLYIKEISSSSQGHYMCIAENAFSAMDRSFMIYGFYDEDDEDASVQLIKSKNIVTFDYHTSNSAAKLSKTYSSFYHIFFFLYSLTSVAV